MGFCCALYTDVQTSRVQAPPNIPSFGRKCTNQVNETSHRFVKQGEVLRKLYGRVADRVIENNNRGFDRFQK